MKDYTREELLSAIRKELAENLPDWEHRYTCMGIVISALDKLDKSEPVNKPWSGMTPDLTQWQK